jgi:hypothetical protein
MSTHIEWAEAAMSSAAYLPAMDLDPLADGDDNPVLVMGLFGDTVIAFTGSKDEMTNLLLEALDAVNSFDEVNGRGGRLGVSHSPRPSM